MDFLDFLILSHLDLSHCNIVTILLIGFFWAIYAANYE